jgi:hypothetical protein
VIYFILNETAGEVKIGMSRRPEVRLKELQNESWKNQALKLIGVGDGDVLQEYLLHHVFRRHRLSDIRCGKRVLMSEPQSSTEWRSISEWFKATG